MQQELEGKCPGRAAVRAGDGGVMVGVASQELVWECVLVMVECSRGFCIVTWVQLTTVYSYRELYRVLYRLWYTTE